MLPCSQHWLDCMSASTHASPAAPAAAHTAGLAASAAPAAAGADLGGQLGGGACLDHREGMQGAQPGGRAGRACPCHWRRSLEAPQGASSCPSPCHLSNHDNQCNIQGSEHTRQQQHTGQHALKNNNTTNRAVYALRTAAQQIGQRAHEAQAEDACMP
eukprot:1147153-Pelagomonas_calceolata.AAC.7